MSLSLVLPNLLRHLYRYQTGFQTVASINAFFLAMTLYPEVMRKAQEEIDSVTGNERLPCFADRPNLPYVNALQLEVFRWHSVVPTGMSELLGYVFDGSLIQVF